MGGSEEEIDIVALSVSTCGNLQSLLNKISVRRFNNEYHESCSPVFAPSGWKEKAWWFSTSDRWAAPSATTIGFTGVNIIIFCLLRRQFNTGGNVWIINGYWGRGGTR